MRQSGRIPAVLYGHGEESVSLSLRHEELEAAVRHRAHLVNLEGGVKESALIQAVQWDTFGVEILHADLFRVRKGEKHEAVVAIQLRGEAPGAEQEHHAGLDDPVQRVEPEDRRREDPVVRHGVEDDGRDALAERDDEDRPDRREAALDDDPEPGGSRRGRPARSASASRPSTRRRRRSGGRHGGRPRRS